jgi:hypothetical protein
LSRKHPGLYVLRSFSAVVAFWFAVAVLAIVVGVQVLQAQWHLFAFLLPPALLLAWAFWIVLYRPAVRYDSAHAVVVNIGRRHVLPWSRVTSVHQGIGMVFDLDAGKPIQASGAPAPRRSGIIGSAIDRRTRPANDLHHDAEILDSVRKVSVSSTEPVVSTWEIVPLILGAVLIVTVVIEFAIGF